MSRKSDIPSPSVSVAPAVSSPPPLESSELSEPSPLSPAPLESPQYYGSRVIPSIAEGESFTKKAPEVL